MNEGLRRVYALSKPPKLTGALGIYNKAPMMGPARFLGKKRLKVQNVQRFGHAKPQSVARPKAVKVYSGERFVDLSEAAVRLGVSRATLWRWRRDGKVPRSHADPGGRRQGWLASEFDAILSKLTAAGN